MKLTVAREDDQSSANTLLRDDRKLASQKVAFFQYSTVAVFLFLITGFWDLQIRNPEVYQERALENSVKSIPVLAPRGKILDRDGRVIVDNHSSFSLYLSRENLKMEHLRPIAEGLNLDYDSLVARVRRFQSRGAPQYEPIPIKEELTPGELAFVDAHKDASTFPELEVVRVQHRLYPRDGMAAHVIGYVGEISESELDSPELARFHQGDIIGKDGIEREYNDQLMGVDGQKRVEVDSFGNERHVLDDKEAIPGKNLQLTIDLDLQAVAELTLENRRGAVVALDPRNGEVLAMVSRPAFDPNLFAGRIKSKDWKVLLDNPDHPLLNRAIQAQQAPGSTFKPIMALAGLESGVIDDNFRISCGGGASFYGRYFKCWGKHGTVGLAPGAGAFLRHIFLQRRQSARYRSNRAVRRDGRLRTQDRHRSSARSGGSCSLQPLEDSQLPREMVSRRDHLGLDRPGSHHCNAAANGLCDRRNVDRRHVVSTSPGEGCRAPDARAPRRSEPGEYRQSC